MDRLPFVDEHAVVVSASRDLTWAALTSYVDRRLASGRTSWLTRLLGTSPASGFEVSSRVDGERVELTGRHRFSQYRLAFSLAGSGPTTLTATTYAAFPGPRGAAYRLLVIGSRAHVVATRRMLDGVRRRAEAGRSSG